MSADDQQNPFDDIFPQSDDTPAKSDAEVKNDEDAALDFHEAAPLEEETPPTNGPASAAPPRIVAEAPLGGVPKPIVPPAPPSPAKITEDDAPDQDSLSLDDLPDSAQAAAQAAAQDAAQGAAQSADDITSTPDKLATMPGDVVAEERRARAEGQLLDDAPADRVPVEPPDPAESTVESPDLAKEARRIVAELGTSASDAADEDIAEDSTAADAASPDDAAEPTPSPDPAAESEPEAAVPPAKRDLPPQPEPVEGIGMADASDFDDISPELAAVLGKPAPPARPAPTDSAPPAAATPTAPGTATESVPEDTAAAPAPAPEPEPDASPVRLTDIAAVRSLPITAEKRSAPAPDTTLTGKVRYVRVEEPLRNDDGQRTQETWEYLKPDYPALGGRLVKEITIEEIAYADGSWEWRYERRYTDKGRDIREVRANADRSYIEREDEVSRLDTESGRRLQFREEAELIFAPPEKEEKRGGLLGGLFGRGDDDDEAEGPKAWREATASETKQVRKQGGEAFKRGGFLGL